jgi:RNA polymerase sigma-70 factor (ECF subfamily)
MVSNVANVAPLKDDRSQVTELLSAWNQGDASVHDRLLSIVYADLHRQAVAAMRRENEGHTLQPTALVHEAYLRLVDQRVEWRNRGQFYAIAAQVMRRILIDHARERHAEKRGAGARPVTLSAVDAQPADEEADVLSLHDALERLALLDPAQARIVELRYFAGLTIEETAEAVGVSPATVKREWATARAWLKRELGSS